MRWERKREKVLPWRHFLIRLGRHALFAGLLILVSLALGLWGYSTFASLSLLDSFHMSSMILAGMGPVADMRSNEAKLFSSFYALYSGIAFLSVNAVFFAPIIHRLMHILQMEQDE